MDESSRKRRFGCSFITTAKDLINENKALHDENQRFRQESAQVKAILPKVERVESNLADAQRQLEKKVGECSRRELDVYHLTNLNQKKRALIDTYKEKVEDLENTIQNLSSANDRLEKDKGKLGEDKKRLGTELVRLEAFNAKLKRESEGRIEDMAAKIEEIRKLKQHAGGIMYEPVDLNEFTAVSVRDVVRYVSPNNTDQPSVRGSTTRVEAMKLVTHPKTTSLPIVLRIDWKGKVAAMTRKNLEESLKQIFTLLCTYGVTDQSLLRRTILSALAGNVVPYTHPSHFTDRDVHRSKMRQWSTGLKKATDDEIRTLIKILLTQTLAENFMP